MKVVFQLCSRKVLGPAGDHNVLCILAEPGKVVP